MGSSTARIYSNGGRQGGIANLPIADTFIPGDANLDGSVDVSDFNLWNQNKFTELAAWSAGDFNADGIVDVSDLQHLEYE